METIILHQESTGSLQSLLSKFSHCSSILRYYGTFSQCKGLMLGLCMETRRCFQDNLVAFRNRLEQGEAGEFVKLELDPGFGEEHVEVLEKIGGHSQCQIGGEIAVLVTLVKEEDILSFCEFVESCSYSCGLIFYEVLVKIGRTVKDESIYNLPYDCLKNSTIDPNCVQIKCTKGFNPKDFKDKIKFTKILHNAEFANCFERVHTLDLTQSPERLDISRITTECLILCVKSLDLYNLLHDQSKKVPMNLSQNVATLKINWISGGYFKETGAQDDSSKKRLSLTKECLSEFFPQLQTLEFMMPEVKDNVHPTATLNGKTRNGVSLLSSRPEASKILTLGDVDVFFHLPQSDYFCCFHADEVSYYSKDCGFNATPREWKGEKYLDVYTYLDLEFIAISQKDEIDLEDFKRYVVNYPMNTHAMTGWCTMFGQDIDDVYGESVLLKYRTVKKIKSPAVLAALKPSGCDILEFKVNDSSTIGKGPLLPLVKVQKPLKFSLRILLSAENVSFICKAIKNRCTDICLIVTDEAIRRTGIIKRKQLVEGICQEAVKPITTYPHPKSTEGPKPSKCKARKQPKKYLRNLIIKYKNPKEIKTMFFLSVGETDRKSLQKILKCE
ncbi:unnamed protein product [Moneuplotes crassus]|uniref:Uncharacterized protein n=1 Tax=Euplotes crassus TaxID=5936 RepID=A0AAD1XTS2_EUPCR|nr:unnamed protein product [Moneuplotes crassus]